MNHTPGPWKICKTTIKGEFCWNYDIRSQDETHVAKISAMHDGNAQLIAAAPDLLDKLKHALEHLEYLTPEQFDDAKHEANWNQFLEDVKQTVANAEGGTLS